MEFYLIVFFLYMLTIYYLLFDPLLINRSNKSFLLCSKSFSWERIRFKRSLCPYGELFFRLGGCSNID